MYCQCIIIVAVIVQIRIDSTLYLDCSDTMAGIPVYLRQPLQLGFFHFCLDSLDTSIWTMPHSKQAPLLLPRSAPSAYPNPSFSMASPVSPPQPHLPTKNPSVAAAIHVLSTERAALAHLEQLYQTDPLAQENLARAVDQIVRSIMNGGKLIFSGVGKSGKIAQKLEATMNSVGVYSAFLHPTEALHGDLGMVRPVCMRPTCFPQEPRPRG